MKFRSFWLEQLGLGVKQKTKRPAVESCLTYMGFDKKQNMRKEVCFLEGENGNYAVSYAGLDGTYQSNRTHYLALLKNFEY